MTPYMLILLQTAHIITHLHVSFPLPVTTNELHLNTILRYLYFAGIFKLSDIPPPHCFTALVTSYFVDYMLHQSRSKTFLNDSFFFFINNWIKEAPH